MEIVKRDGSRDTVKFDKILRRVQKLKKGLNVEPVYVSQKVVAGLYENMTTVEIDSLLAETSAVLTSEHPDYSILAARIAVSSLHKQTVGFYDTMKILFKANTLSEDFIELVRHHGRTLDDIIDDSRDFQFDYFGFKTLEKSYLLKVNNAIVERPQHIYMRVALALGQKDLDRVKEIYNDMSLKYATHATPTLFNAGLKKQQLSSCFLVAMEEDSIPGIYRTLGDVAVISQHAGGVGLHASNIRAKGSLISGTNGVSNGLRPMLRVFNETARYVDQGGGKRKGSFAIYMELWHADIEDFLELKLAQGKDENRTRDLYLALWVSDLFMERLLADEDWSLFCPTDTPDLQELYDDRSKNEKAFSEAYLKYEKMGLAKKTLKASKLLEKIMDSMAESGTPYIVFKDAANSFSNQKNLGTIKSSNLCAEIIEYSDDKETAVCNLASVALPSFVKGGKKPYFDFKHFGEVVERFIKNLNQVIDINYYPTEKTKRSNLRHRPVGLGWQGLADTLIKMRLPFESEEALKLNREISEYMYYHSVKSSMELAKVDGAYKSFKGSPASKGQLQFDLQGVQPITDLPWDQLREDVKQHGLRNSLLIALMPTASTSSIFGNEECFQPITFNIGKRSVLAGEFIIVNKHLVEELESLGLWNKEMKDKIIENNGSIQTIEEIPLETRELFKTAFEVKQSSIIKMAAERNPFVCQSQSMNLFWKEPSFGKYTTALVKAWKSGLKTGSYYMHTEEKMGAKKVTLNKEITDEALNKTQEELQEQAQMCSIEDPDSCVMCGS